jgi:hypothetical protein
MHAAQPKQGRAACVSGRSAVPGAATRLAPSWRWPKVGRPVAEPPERAGVEPDTMVACARAGRDQTLLMTTHERKDPRGSRPLPPEVEPTVTLRELRETLLGAA